MILPYKGQEKGLESWFSGPLAEVLSLDSSIYEGWLTLPLPLIQGI